MGSRVLLVQPNYREKPDAEIWTCNPPLGPCYIAAVLEKKKISVEILDANVENLSVSKTARIIKRKNPQFVGFSILTPAYNWCVEVIKRLPKNIITVAGGPHPSGIPEESLKSGFDIVVRGEGEVTLFEIVMGKKLKDVSGIIYRQGRKIIYTPPRIPLDPDTLPFPARHLINQGGTDRPYISQGTRYYPWAQLFTSRGCPYNCYFCNKNIFGYRYRPRTPENVLEEIDFLVNKYHVREIDIYDDNFNFDMDRAEKIMDMVIKRGYKLYFRFSNGIRADKVNIRLLKKMKQAGTNYIAYGVESGDPKILKMIPKGETLAQIRKAVKLTHEVGIPVTGFFIFGLIGDTIETMQKTVDFTLNNDFDQIILNIATPYPGTRMWKMIKEGGGEIFIKKWQDFYNTSGKMVYSLPGMATREEVEETYRKAHLAFYFRPKYLVSQIPKLFSLSMIPIIYRGLKRVIYAQKTKYIS